MSNLSVSAGAFRQIAGAAVPSSDSNKHIL